MKKLILLLFIISSNIYGATCTSLSRNNNAANSVLTSSGLNTDFNQLITGHNVFDLGCGTIGTLELDALSTTDFLPQLNAIREGCEMTMSDSNTITIDQCFLSVNGKNVKTTSATTATWGCSGCSSEATGTQYYVYAKDGSTGTTLTPLLTTTAPDGDSYDSSDNRIIGSFFNDNNSDIATNTQSWVVNNFISDDQIESICIVRDVKATTVDGGTCTSGTYLTRDLNTISSGCEFMFLASNQMTFIRTGTYLIISKHVSSSTNGHKTRLIDIDGNDTLIVGSPSYSASASANNNTSSWLFGKFIISSLQTRVEIQHRCTTTANNNGFGLNMALGLDEIYSQAIILKLRN